MTLIDWLLILVLIIFPPAEVFFVTGCSGDFGINILLTLLGYLPGLVHGGYVLYKKVEAEKKYPGLAVKHLKSPGVFGPSNSSMRSGV